ncbi:tRNA(His) guanylyltransferase Thg1 family protein [Actinomadura sp. LOL_016]|uniref:tRNA(His) guanylyltransferase Thg1 family protein n=1 Tax=unclassified Actinomadura TaxID=2626254 RepID=UPI003A8115D2
MRSDDLEARMRARERFHALTLHPGAWTIVRVDGRAFSKYTETRFDKPFDPRFSALMAGAAEALLTELGGRYAYTESDEISVVLDPSYELFGREVEKLVSLSARGGGCASSANCRCATRTARSSGVCWAVGERAWRDGRPCVRMTDHGASSAWCPAVRVSRVRRERGRAPDPGRRRGPRDRR